MKLTRKQINIINAETIKQYPKEAVIAITKGNAYPLDNIHSDPENHFRVDSVSFFKLNPIALVHSHPVKFGENPSPDIFMYYDPRTPSSADMSMQEQLNIPFGIISYDSETITDVLWFPDLDKELIGRDYVHGVWDCYSIIRAYYWQNYKVLLKDYPRSYDWWENGGSLYTDNVEGSGFYEIKEQDLEEGDMIYMSITGGVESHGAIYTGDSKIIHHLAARLSCEDSYTRWRRKMTRFFRHKDKPINIKYKK